MIVHRIHEAVSVVSRDMTLRWRSRGLSSREVFRELVLCILGSQVTHEMSVAAFEQLRRRGLLDRAGASRDKRPSLREFESALTTPRGRPRYRFPRMAAARLARLYAALPGGPKDLVRLISVQGDSRKLRRALTELRCGVGPKQASLFLRNIGKADDLAILDTHSVRFMHIAGLSPSATPPRDLRDYEEREDRLRSYVAGLAQPLARFDAALWIVMRAARSERVL